MSRQCSVCKKKPRLGMKVSHSMHHTKRLWLPNLQKVRIIVGGKSLRAYVCAKCLKSGKVKKAA